MTVQKYEVDPTVFDPDLQALTPEEENAILQARMRMAQAYTQMLQEALDAQRCNGVNYRELPEFKDQSLLQAGAKLPPHRAEPMYMEWIDRVNHGIRARIRRGGLKLV